MSIEVNYTHSFVETVAGSTLLVAANQNRKFMLIINDSDTVAYISFNNPAVPNNAIRLSANGFWFAMSPALDNMNYGAMYVAAAGNVAGKRVLVNEAI